MNNSHTRLWLKNNHAAKMQDSAVEQGFYAVFFMLYSKENYYSTLVLCLLRCRGDRSSAFLSSDWLIGVIIVSDWSIEWTLQLRWFTLGLDDDAERVVFYEKCMSIIVIIITPNGDWNYGYILTTYNLHKQYEILGAKDIPWKHFLR